MYIKEITNNEIGFMAPELNNSFKTPTKPSLLWLFLPIVGWVIYFIKYMKYRSLSKRVQPKMSPFPTTQKVAKKSPKRRVKTAEMTTKSNVQKSVTTKTTTSSTPKSLKQKALLRKTLKKKATSTIRTANKAKTIEAKRANEGAKLRTKDYNQLFLAIGRTYALGQIPSAYKRQVLENIQAQRSWIKQNQLYLDSSLLDELKLALGKVEGRVTNG